MININSYQNNIYFKANLNSKKLKFKPNDFYIKIRGYGRNEVWANEIIETSDKAVGLVRKGVSAENILKFITSGVRRANANDFSYVKKTFSGVLRQEREGWLVNNSNADVFTMYNQGRYKSYEKRLDYVAKHPLDVPIETIGMTLPNEQKAIFHGEAFLVNNSLDYVFNLCNKIIPKYINNEVKERNLDEINSIIAEMRWVLAHSTPWLGGSDAISNVLIRVLYKAMGIKTYPIAQGKSLDLEAYCTNLKDYKKNFAKYFSKPPEIV